MKKFPIIVLLLANTFSGPIFAATSTLLNTISYQVTEQQWVKSSNALAVIAISATVSDQNVAKLRQSIIKNLQQLASGNWHITEFTRSKTSSGLDSINARVQIRLPADQLNQITSRIKSVSKAGQTYSVVNLSFNPSLADMTAAQVMLRKKIYEDIQNELKNVNRQFSRTRYFVHQINFVSGLTLPPRTVGLLKMATNTAAPTVTQQTTLTARVILSSKVNGSDGS